MVGTCHGYQKLVVFDHDYNYTQEKGLKVDNGVFILAISACLPTIAEHVIAMAVIE